MAPATNSETAARRRMRRTRMRSAATSGAGGHDAPPGQLAASSAWTSAALDRPLTTVSAVTSRSPMVASGRSASARSRRTCSSAPVSISRVDSWRWCRNVGGSPRRPRCSCTTSEVAPGQAKKPVSRWVSSGTSAPPTMTPDAPASTAARVASRASVPSISSCACAIGPRARRAAGPGGRQALAAERPPDATRGEWRPRGASTASSATAMTTVDDEAREPGGVVGPLQRGLLAWRAEERGRGRRPRTRRAADSAIDGQRERRRPEVAAQPPVQHARGDEATRQPRIVQALHAGQPGPVVGGRGVHRGVAVGPQRAGAHEHRARARRRSRRPGRSPSRTVTPRRSRVCATAGIALGGRHHGDHLGVGAGGERSQRVGELRVLLDDAGRIVGGAAGRHEPAAQDDDARALPFRRAAGRCRGRRRRELSVGSGGSRRSPMTSTLRPRATGSVRSTSASAAGPRLHPRVGFCSHSSSIVSPSGASDPSQLGGFALPEGCGARR